MNAGGGGGGGVVDESNQPQCRPQCSPPRCATMTTSTAHSSAAKLLLLLYLLVDDTVAFVSPKTFIPTVRAPATGVSLMSSLPSTLVVNGAEQSIILTTTSLESSTTFLAEEGAGGVLLTIASVIVILVFGFGALLLVMANIIIPKAAEELENKARKEYPELWAETEAKLEEDEVLAVRPDLMQSLGKQVQEADYAKFRELERRSVEGTETSMESDIVDVEVITMDEGINDKK